MTAQTEAPPVARPPDDIPPGGDPVAQTLALIRPWIDYVPQKQRRLGLFVFLALLVHIATFFFIRIDTTRAELQHQARTHVTVEGAPTVSREPQSDNEFWDRLTDPRLFLFPQQSVDHLAADQPSLDFTALGGNIGPSGLPPAAQAGDYPFIRQVIPSLEAEVEASMHPLRQPFSYDETPPAIAATTQWQWDNTLAQRQPTSVPALPSPESDTDLSPTELRIAIDSDGTVQHVLVEQSSGKMGASIARDLDQQAVLAARKIRFQRNDQPGLVWGRATIFWHYAAKPREEVVPTPPTPQ